jgi:hypothetical protein
VSCQATARMYVTSHSVRYKHKPLTPPPPVFGNRNVCMHALTTLGATTLKLIRSHSRAKSLCRIVRNPIAAEVNQQETRD